MREWIKEEVAVCWDISKSVLLAMAVFTVVFFELIWVSMTLAATTGLVAALLAIVVYHWPSPHPKKWVENRVDRRKE